MIDENRIKNTVESFSFPRLSGTKDEEKALNLMVDKLSKLNLEPKVQKFEFSTFYSRTYLKIGFLFSFLNLFFFYFNFESILILMLLFVMFITLIVLFLITRNPENIKLRRLLPSANVYVKLESQKERKNNELVSEHDILFFCHLDSKGQKFTIQTRIRAIQTWFYSALILCIIIVLKNYIFIDSSLLIFIFGIIPFLINLITTILLVFNTTNNVSPGAIDNASGISCVFELLNHYIEPFNRLENSNLVFVFTGAEECGTMGIRHFEKLIHSLDKSSVLFFNFDVIAQSAYVFPVKKRSKDTQDLYSSLVNNESDYEHYELKKVPKTLYIGAHSDGYYLKQKGYQGIGFADMDVYNFIHSENDTPDKINYSLLKDLCELITIRLAIRDKQL